MCILHAPLGRSYLKTFYLFSFLTCISPDANKANTISPTAHIPAHTKNTFLHWSGVFYKCNVLHVK